MPRSRQSHHDYLFSTLPFCGQGFAIDGAHIRTIATDLVSSGPALPAGFLPPTVAGNLSGAHATINLQRPLNVDYFWVLHDFRALLDGLPIAACGALRGSIH